MKKTVFESEKDFVSVGITERNTIHLESSIEPIEFPIDEAIEIHREMGRYISEAQEKEMEGKSWLRRAGIGW